MPTRNISLTAEQDAFVEKLVEAGKYQNASEADYRKSQPGVIEIIRVNGYAVYKRGETWRRLL